MTAHADAQATSPVAGELDVSSRGATRRSACLPSVPPATLERTLTCCSSVQGMHWPVMLLQCRDDAERIQRARVPLCVYREVPSGL